MKTNTKKISCLGQTSTLLGALATNILQIKGRNS